MGNRVENFTRLIDFLTNSNIQYALLGRRDSLNEIVDGDIDLVVSTKNFKRISLIIQEFASQNNMQLIQCLEHETTAKYFILSDKSNHSMISPDICSSYLRNKRLLIDNGSLMQNRKAVTIEGLELFVLTPEYEFLYYFLKKTDKNSFAETAFKHLLKQFEESDILKLKENLSPYFSQESTELVTTAFQSNSLEVINGNLTGLIKELHANKKVKISYALKDLALKLKRVFYKTGLSIVLLGTDGSGKSTVIEGVSKGLKDGFRNLKYYHLYPQEPDKETKANTDPQGQTPHSFIKSQIKLAYFASKYIFGYIKINFKLVRSTLVIFDRYYDDILVDKRRFRYKGPEFFLKITNIFIPKPKLYIYLDAPSQVIFSRKAELSLDEIDRQRKSYLKIMERKKRGYVINANQEPEKVIFDTETKILDYLEERQAKRI